MSKLTYIGKIEDGKMILTDPVRSQMLSELKAFEGKRVEIEIKKLPRRSNAQNAYYWGVVVGMVKGGLIDLGHSVDANDTHYFLKDKFNGIDFCNNDGEYLGRIGGSTSKLNKPEFMDYLAKIQIWAAQHLGIVIPDPNEQTQLNFEEPTPSALTPLTDEQAYSHVAA